MTPRKKKFQTFFPSFSRKKNSLEIFERQFTYFFVFNFDLMENVKKIFNKIDCYGNTPEGKTVEAAWLKF
jgi:hypothetical protein